MKKSNNFEEKSQYVPLVIAKTVSAVLKIVGAVALIMFAISVIGDVRTNNLAAKKVSAEEVSAEALMEPLPPVSFGVGKNISVSESAHSIVELFQKHDAKAYNYLKFRTILADNTVFFMEALDEETVISSTDDVGSDTVAFLTKGDSVCEIILEGTLITKCE